MAKSLFCIISKVLHLCWDRLGAGVVFNRVEQNTVSRNLSIAFLQAPT